MIENNISKNRTRDLTDKDFYQQACEYFYYHAEQRTTMINYFIAVFAACLALYGSLITAYSLASTLIAVFLFIVSLLFYSIDLRNRFDVKQSQTVIAQFESDYYVDRPEDYDGKYAFGVFSNEDNTFKYYGYKKRRAFKENSYMKLRKLYKKKVKLEKENNDNDSIDDINSEYNSALTAFLYENANISKKELENSFTSGSIITLSFSIKMLYYVCMLISLLAFFFALLITINVI